VFRDSYARDNGIDVRFGRADELPFKNEEFDVVISKNFLCPYYVDKFELDTPRIISDVYRVLKPGGRYFSDNEIFLFERNKAVPPFAAAHALGPEFTTASRWFSVLTTLEKAAHN
jgi:ubiquinone/menaquinone biosynthesis C-methylase UbiE